MEMRERVRKESSAPSSKECASIPIRIKQMIKEDILTDIDYLYKAFKKSQTRRSYTVSSVMFEENVFKNLRDIQKEIKDRTYQVSGYTEFEVTIPKRRTIKACKFKDKVVQHVLCDNILVPMLPGICITDNYAGQQEKGTGMARKCLIEKIKNFEFTTGQKGYIYRGDIHKYYYNINHGKAKDIMEYHFPAETHWLIDEFIDSTSDNTAGDAGLALGNQINTIVSCLYLDGFDKFITGELGIKYYGRYADDFYLLHESKEYLKYCAVCIQEYLATLGLELNPKSQIIPFKNGVSFVGFHYWVKEGKVRIQIDNGKKRAYRRKFNRMRKKVERGEMTLSTLLRSYRSWKNHASICTDKRIFQYYDKKINELKEKQK